MSFDDLSDLWKSTGNQPARAEIENQRENFVASLRRDRRMLYARLGLAVVLLMVPLVVFAARLAGDAPFPFAPAREWGVWVLLALPAIGAVLFFRSQRRHDRMHADYGRSADHTLRAMVDANQAAQQRARVMMVLLGLSAPALALSVWQLQEVGKARPHEAASLVTLMAVVLAASWGRIFWKRRQLSSQRLRLESLLTELRQTETAP